MLTLCCAGTTTPPASAQNAPPLADPFAPPAPQAAMRAWAGVEAWVRDGRAPAGLSDETASQMPTVHGACVTLMLGGQTIGRGTVIEQVPGVEVIRSAAAEAIRRARGHIPRASDDQMRRAHWATVRISIELTGALIPVDARIDEAIALAFAPGLDGAALRRGERLTGVFPSRLLARHTAAGEALPAMVGQLSDDAGEMNQPMGVLAERGYTLYRFATTHLVEPIGSDAPVFLHRGSRVIREPQITTESMRWLADRLAEHLMRRKFSTENDGIALNGGTDPYHQQDQTALASPMDTATAAYALARFARYGTRTDSLERAKSVVIAVELIGSLTADDLKDPASSAMAWLAFVETITVLETEGFTMLLEGQDHSAQATWDQFHKVVVPAFDEQDGFHDSVPGGAKGLIAYALVQGGKGPLARAAVTAAYRDTPPGELAGQMPWLGMASVELARRTGEPLSAAAALLEMRTHIWLHQLTRADLDARDRDLAGGIVFTRGSDPLPTWHTLRPLAFLGVMLGEPSLTPGSPTGGVWPGEMVRLLGSIRFLRQLVADDAAAWGYAQPTRTIYGVRASPFDHHQPIQATALGLITLVETLESMERAVGRRNDESE